MPAAHGTPSVSQHRKEVMDVDTESYQTPQVTDLGDVTELTLGTAADDTADMNTARYY